MRKIYVEASCSTVFCKEKKKALHTVPFSLVIHIFFSFIHNENLLNCHFLANNLRLLKAKDTLTNDEILATW